MECFECREAVIEAADTVVFYDRRWFSTFGDVRKLVGELLTEGDMDKRDSIIARISLLQKKEAKRLRVCMSVLDWETDKKEKAQACKNGNCPNK